MSKSVGYNQYLKPTISSFFKSLVWDFSFAITATWGLYFKGKEMGWFIIIPSIAMYLFSVLYFSQSIVVHLKKIMIHNEGIQFSGLTGRPYGFKWHEIKKATMRERNNFISGTKKILIFSLINNDEIAYNISTLSKIDEKFVFSEVKKRTPISTIFDKGPI